MTQTQESLIASMQQAIGPALEEAMGWQAPDSYEPIIADALYILGIESLADAHEDDDARLRAAARFAVWDTVANHTVGWHDITTDGQSLKLESVHKNAVKRAAGARRALAGLGVEGAAVALGIQRITWRPPYGKAQP